MVQFLVPHYLSLICVCSQTLICLVTLFASFANSALFQVFHVNRVFKLTKKKSPDIKFFCYCDRVYSRGDGHSDAFGGSSHLTWNVQDLHNGRGIAATLSFSQAFLSKWNAFPVIHTHIVRRHNTLFLILCINVTVYRCRCTAFARAPEPWRYSPPVPTSFVLLRSLRRWGDFSLRSVKIYDIYFSLNQSYNKTV